MKIFIIIILVIFIIIIYKNKKKEHFTIDDEINTNVNNIFKTDFSFLEKLSKQIDEFKKTQNINIPDNLKNTGILKINTNTSSSEKQVTINNSINFTNKNSQDVYLDIFPKNYIMVWATDKYIPKGWVICDGSTYLVDKTTITKISSDTEKISGNIYIKVPDFRGLALRGINLDTSNTLFNSQIGLDNIEFPTDKIPLHEHWLPTNIDRSKDYIEGVGFQYENMIINSDYLFRLDGLRYKCFDAPKCVFAFGFDCYSTCYYNQEEANRAHLEMLNLRYALWDTMIKWPTSTTKYSRLIPDKHSIQTIRQSFTSSITPIMPDIDTIDAALPIPGTKSKYYPYSYTDNLKIYYGNSYNSDSKNYLIVTTGEPLNSKETKLVDAPPAYYVLNYIIKLT